MNGSIAVDCAVQIVCTRREEIRYEQKIIIREQVQAGMVGNEIAIGILYLKRYD